MEVDKAPFQEDGHLPQTFCQLSFLEGGCLLRKIAAAPSSAFESPWLFPGSQMANSNPGPNQRHCSNDEVALGFQATPIWLEAQLYVAVHQSGMFMGVLARVAGGASGLTCPFEFCLLGGFDDPCFAVFLVVGCGFLALEGLADKNSELEYQIG